MAVDQTADAVQANAQYLAQGAAMVSVAQQIEQAVAGQLAVFRGVQQAVSDLSSAMQSLPGQLSGLSTGLKSGGEAGFNFLETTNQIVGILGDFDGAATLVRDTLNGTSEAAKKLEGTGKKIDDVGAAVLRAAGPYVIVAAAIAALGVAVHSLDGKDAALLSLSAQLKGTGRDSLAAVKDIDALVEVLNALPGVSRDSAVAVISEFAKVPEIGSELFKSLGSSVADFAAATGTDLPAAASKLAEAFADPAKGARSLEDSLGTLSAAQLLNIENMVEMGDKAGAQAALLYSLRQATKGLASEAMTPLGKATDDLSNAWDRFTKALGNSQGIQAAKSGLVWFVGKVAELIDVMAQMKPPPWVRSLPGIGPLFNFVTPMPPQSGGSRTASGKVRYPEEEAADQQAKAALEATQSFETQASAMERLKGVAKQAQDALKALEEQNKGTSVEANTLRDRIAGVNERLAEMAKRGNVSVGVRANAKPQAQKDTEDQAKLAVERAGLLPEFAQEWELLNKQYRESTLSMEQLEKKQAELLAKQPFMIAKEADELKALTQQRQNAADVRNKDYASVEAYMESEKQLGVQTVKAIEGRIAAMELEEKAASMAAAQNITLAEAIKRVNIERLTAKRDGPTGLTEGSPAYEQATKETDALTREADRINANDRNAKARDSEKKAQKDFEQWSNNLTSGVSDSLVTAIFEGGEKGGEQLRKQLQDSLIKQPLKMFINAGVNYGMQALGGLFGMGGGAPGQLGGGGGGALGTIGSVASLAQTGYSAYTGTGIFASGAGGAGGGLSSMMSAMGPAAAYMAVALAVINVLGGMRSERMIGSGLKGTLGNGSKLEPWEEWREGGTLASGPDFSTHNPLETIEQYKKKIKEQEALGELANLQSLQIYQTVLANLQNDHADLLATVGKQDRAIQSGYEAYRKNVVDMANTVGLAGDSLKTFAYTLDQQDLNFKDLKPEEVQEKIAAAYGKAGVAMARELLGEGKPVTETRTNVTAHENSTGEKEYSYTSAEETTTRMVYFSSQYALAGETAYETLERLATNFHTLNEAADALGFGIQQGSLALADFAADFIEAFGGLERFTASTNAFLQNYYSDEERRDYIARSGSRRLEKLGINISAEQLLDATGEDVKNAVNSTSTNPALYADVMDVANFIASLYQVSAQAAPAVENLSNAVDELTQKFNGAKEALLNDAKSLSVDLLRAQGKEGDAKALERQQYLDGFVDEHGNKLDEGRLQQLTTLYDGNAATRRAIEVQNERNGLQDELNALTDDATQALTRQRDALDESNRALFDNVQAIKLQKTIADELPGVVDKYLSPAQRRQSQYDKVTADLNAVGIKVSAEQLMGLSRAQIGSAAMDIYNTAGVPDEARLAVVRAAGALADLKNADVDTAFAALERAVDAQRKVLDEAITELTSVFETARDAAKTLFGEVESAVQFQGDEGRAFISNALAVAQSTGYLPDSEKFSKAVSDATGALGQQMFATQAESDYQRLVLANELKGLQDISGDQLEKAKDELEYLDEQLAEQRKQIDVLNGIDLSVQSVAGAISALGTAMNGARSATTLGGAGLAAYDKELGVGRNAAGTLFQRDDIRLAASNALEAGANPRDIYNVIKGSGFTLAQAGVILGTEPGSLEDFAREMNWPVFHRGTRRVPRTGFALLQQGEAVIPAAYNPFAAGRGWGNSKDMLAAMEGVRAELIEVRRQNDALQRAAMRTADAVNGRPEAPMLVESV